MTTVLVAIAVFTPLAGAISAWYAPDADRAGRWTTSYHAVAAAVAAVVVALTALESSGVPDGLADLPDAIALSIDRTSAVLLLAVVGTGAVIASFSRRSLDNGRREVRYFALIGAVVTGSALVVVPSGPIWLVAGWMLSSWALVELTVGWVDTRGARRATARLRRTMLVSDMGLVLAVVIAVAVAGPGITFGQPDAFGDLATSELAGVDAALVVSLLLVVAGAARSAMLPFHRWLVGTLYAPTPVSALVHAGFVSGAGILLIRFAGAFAISDAAVIAAFVLAVATIVVGISASLTRSDIKGSLAWSTVAQMSFMVAQVAVGAFAGAVFHIVGHGMYKAAQFLGAGGTPTSNLADRRRPAPHEPMSEALRWGVVLGAPTIAVAAAFLVIPPNANDAGQIIQVVFAWLALAAAIRGWVARRPLAPTSTALSSFGVALVGAGLYFSGLRLAKEFLDPNVPPAGFETAVGPIGVIVAIAVVGVGATTLWRLPDLRSAARWYLGEVIRPDRPLDLRSVGATPTSAGEVVPVARTEPADRAVLSVDVNTASEIIAPQWPLASFVAVNPLTGVEAEGFDGATAIARRWLRADTTLPLSRYRADHHRGVTNRADLEAAIRDHLGDRTDVSTTSLESADVVSAVDVVAADLLHGPEASSADIPRTALERRLGPTAPATLGVDELVGEWITDHLSPAAWPAGRTGETLMRTAKRLAARHARTHLGSEPAARWIEQLGNEPAAIAYAALVVAGVEPDERVDELRGHLASVNGWSGIAKWRTEWAHADERVPPLSPIDVVAVRSMIEAAVLITLGGAMPAGPAASSSAPAATLDDRVRVVVKHLGIGSVPDARDTVASVLTDVDADDRPMIWLAAQERAITHDFVRRFDDRATPAELTPDAQLVFCIDVRSEGLRRHIEALGHDETFGFAGFFGVPMRVQELGWERPEARCPVLVSPAVTAREQGLDGSGDAIEQSFQRSRVAGGVYAAHRSVKHDLGAPFATAEAAGWVVGPTAAARTFIPRRTETTPAEPAGLSQLELDPDIELADQINTGEAVLRTMGLISGFAPLVVLSGHTSLTTNNPHATALECGACAGASGAGNARAVAALLNAAGVREGLRGRGIEVPDSTWFLPALHDTPSDVVTLLDTHLAPESHRGRISALRDRLASAGAAQAAVRAADLPGADERVRDRGLDWAQIRPEWGLARNAAFVIAPRSVTAPFDLEGRAFLHSYEEARDPTGQVLETIMTAPLVVGHWISSQYYFSTVDPEVLGAGDKLVHNPIGSLGVISGPGGDLRVGFPLQSTRIDDDPFHQPVRLMAVIQADLDRIDEIIARNAILGRLVGGRWFRILGRSSDQDPWSLRSPSGGWTPVTPDRIADGAPPTAPPATADASGWPASTPPRDADETSPNTTDRTTIDNLEAT